MSILYGSVCYLENGTELYYRIKAKKYEMVVKLLKLQKNVNLSKLLIKYVRVSVLIVSSKSGRREKIINRDGQSS